MVKRSKAQENLPSERYLTLESANKSTNNKSAKKSLDAS